VVVVGCCLPPWGALGQCPEEVSLDLGDVFQVRDCQAGLRRVRRGNGWRGRRHEGGRGGCALGCGQRQGGGGREPGQGDGQTAGAVAGVHDDLL